MSSERGRLFASLHTAKTARRLGQPHSPQRTALVVCILLAFPHRRIVGSPTSWLSPPRTPSAANLWLWTGLRHPRKVGDYDHCSRPRRGNHGRLLDMACIICTFVLCMKSKARAEKRSEVETGLDGLGRRCAALSADAGLAGALADQR
jgi:hypothetical protein